MKNVLLLAACTFLFLACSESKDPKQDRDETLKKNFATYINAMLSGEEKQDVSIDSIEILKVDTLTEQGYVAMKMNYFVPQFKEQIKLVELDASNLANAKAFNYDDQTLNQLQEKFNEDNQKMEEMSKKNNEMLAEMEKASDKKFKCYQVAMKVHVTEKGASKIIDILLPANQAFKPIDVKHL